MRRRDASTKLGEATNVVHTVGRGSGGRSDLNISGLFLPAFVLNRVRLHNA